MRARQCSWLLDNQKSCADITSHHVTSRHDPKLDIDESAKSHQALKPTQSKKAALF